VFVFIHTLDYQDQDCCQELGDRFSCCIKSLKRTKVGVLVVVVNLRKK